MAADDAQIARASLRHAKPRHHSRRRSRDLALELQLQRAVGAAEAQPGQAIGDEAQTIDVMAGEVLHIPSHVQHKAEALEDTLDVDIFSPPRQDWLDKTDDYLRHK